MTYSPRFNSGLFPITRAFLLTCLLLLLPIDALQAADAAVKPFDVPSGAASRTLKLFAQQSGREIVFSAESIGGTTTNAVRGEFTARDALDRMTAGTGLTVGVDEKSGLFSVRNETTAPNAPRATAAAPALARPSQDAGEEPKAVVLSPFQVEAGREQGYLATQTLNGTRLKTDLKDIGSALTIFTEQLLDDLAAHNINDVLMFAPNTDPFVNRLSEARVNGNDILNNPTIYVTRGGSTTVVSQDFFPNSIPQDRYNSEAITFTRGPNSILFGLGNPAGAFVTSTKRAKNQTATALEFFGDERDSYRIAVDHNQVIRKELLSVRYNGVYEMTRSYRYPSKGNHRRQFVTATFTPFKRTSIRLNYEGGFIRQPAIRPWPIFDGVSPWIAAGSPMLSTYTNTPAKPAGTNIANYGSTGPVSTQFSPGGTVLPIQRRPNEGLTALPTYATGFPVTSGANMRSFINPAVYPTLASSLSDTSYRRNHYRIYTAFIEQQITKDLFVEGAINRLTDDRHVVDGFIGNADILYADVNRQLPNGAPNPNAGKLYTESNMGLIVNPTKSLAKRGMASYDLDLTRRGPTWLRYLGRHRAAAFLEQQETQTFNSNMRAWDITNAARFSTPNAKYNWPGSDLIGFRYYYDPAAGKVGNPGSPFANFPILYANSPLPPADPSGVTIAYVNTNGPSANRSEITTRAFALQSSFWQGRLILTNGLRTDRSRAWSGAAANFEPFRDQRGITADPRGFDVRTAFPASLRERDGHTSTRGAVLHALPWLSFAYNTSDNFQVNAATRNVYGDLLPNPKGRGSDYGIKLFLFDQKLVFDVMYYTNETVDKIDPVSITTAGNFVDNLNVAWEAIAGITGDSKYRSSPYDARSAGNWSDSTSTRSTGWEFSATANPTKQWRLTINGSKRSTASTTARGVNIIAYLNEYLPLLRNPAWQSATTPGSTLTVADRVATIQTTLSNFVATRNLPEDIYAPSWSLNLIQTYSFARESRLAGFSIGGSMNARGKSIAGFGETRNDIFDPDLRYYAPSFENFGAWITYQRKLFSNRVDWRLQLNVRNVFDAYKVYLNRAVDARDGRHTQANVIYRLNEPRTFALTSAFKY